MTHEEYKYREYERKKEAIKFLLKKNYPIKDLLEIYDNLNRGEWDERVGEKPNDFDNLKNYKSPNVFQVIFGLDSKKDTKHTIIYPRLLAIETLIPVVEMKKHLIRRWQEIWKDTPGELQMTEEEVEIEARALALAEKKN